MKNLFCSFTSYKLANAATAAFLLVVTSGFHGSAAWAQPFTLEDVLSAPYPENLVSSGDGRRIAWTETNQGARSVVTATAPDFEPRRIAHFPKDDGRPLSALSLSADGAFAVFTRGGAKNWDGDHPNPDSAPEGAFQRVWMAPTDGSGARLVGEGARGITSPDGKTVLIQRAGKLYQYTIGRIDEEVGEPLFQVRGSVANVSWSPSGEKILFVSNRNGHSFVGVYDIANDEIRWMGPSVYRDMHPVWRPSGAEVAFMRRPGRLNGERMHLMTAWGFSIMVADVATGATREVWRSPNEMAGGLAQRYFPKPLRWTQTGRLVFYSEQDGYMRLYSVASEGGDAIALTPEACEAEDSALSFDETHVVFSHNCGDVDRRDIASISVAGGEVKPLSNGQWIETNPTPLAGGLVALRKSGPKSPTRIALLNGDGRFISAPAPAEFPSTSLSTPKQAVFPSTHGFTIHGQLFLPPELEEGEKVPALIFMHGGPIRQMLLGWHYRGYYANAYAMNQYLAAKGYIVLAVNYRAGIGYGRDFRLVPDHGPRGASEYNDILAAAKYLKSIPQVDHDKIGLWGGSYGGFLTAQGLARDSETIAAGVDLHGVHDWSLDFPKRPGRAWGIVPEEMELARQSSPVAHIDGWRSPVLFIHGDDDRNVVFWETTDLAMRLDKKGVHWEALVLPDEVHGFYRHASWLSAFSATADFFDRMLMDNKTPAP
ncbi:MAG: prolyl oligopeptidase family serine peptidase [Pseudomonadota bacterium]